MDSVYIDTVPALKKLVGATNPATGEPTVNINLVYIFEVYSQNNFSMSGFNITGDTTTPGDNYGVLEMWGNTGTLTLSDLVVRNLAANGVGIDIYNNLGPVVLQNVEASNNSGGGAYIDNNQITAYPVTIKNSSFQSNGGTVWTNGLYIYSNGAVLLDGVTVRYNGDNDGSLAAAFIESSKALTVKNSVFSNNWSSGLVNYWTDAPFASTNGPVLLDNVFANDNWYFYDIENEFGGAGIALVTNGLFTANNVTANGNKYQGMIADTCWSQETFTGSGEWVCTTTATGNVVITNSQFNHNNSNSSGLLVDAKGAITLTNVNAAWNQGIDRDPLSPTYGLDSYVTAGARLNNYSFTTAYPVTVNTSTFEWNIDDGLEINSKGLVTINKVSAYENSVVYDAFGNRTASLDGYGIDIDNTDGVAGVTFKGLTRYDNTIYNNAYGLRVVSNGAILINYLNSNNNTYVNADLVNQDGTGNVTVNNSTFYSSRADDGLVIASKGVVSMNTVSARWNSGNGLRIDNSTSSTPKGVTITNGFFTGNSGSGLDILSKGVITLKNVEANDNGEYGAHLVNNTAATPQGVIITGGDFNGNQGFNGLLVESRGAVTLTNVSVSDNSLNNEWIYYGDYVYEVASNNYSDSWWFDGLTGEVINFGLLYQNGQAWTDLVIELYYENGNLVYETASGDPVNSEYFGNVDYDSAITGFVLEDDGLYRIQVSNWNWDASGSYYAEFWEGAGPWAGDWTPIISNANGAGIQTEGAVTITNANSWDYGFNYNNGYGLDILTKGLVKLTNVNASYNTGFGADILNQVDGATAGATLIGSTFDGNDLYGLEVASNGAVLLTKTIANENLDYGAIIDNTPLAGTAKPAVTIINDATKVDWWHEGFSGNGDSGLQISSKGVISLTNVNASDNGSTGAAVQNISGTADVKLTNSKFDNNDGDGVSVYTRGNIIYSKGSANNNHNGNGAWIETYPLIGIKNVTITNVEFKDNYGSGLHVVNNGNITLTNVQANWNYGEDLFMVYAKGADLNNEAGLGNITIKNGEFSGNKDTGLLIATHGNVTLTTVHADNNGSMGAWIGSDFEPGHVAKVVAISGMSTFYDNGNSGMAVYATGAITLTNVDSGGNGGYGAYLNNTYGTLPANVSVLGTLSYWTNWFGDNDQRGLFIETKGAVVVNKVDASNNASDGVVIDNSTATLPANVTINTGWYNDNAGIGPGLAHQGHGADQQSDSELQHR